MDVSLASLLAIIGVSLGILEIAILGFGTVFLLFIAIGCLVTAVLMFFGALPDTYLVAAIAVAIISSVAALLLWKPLKKMQDKQQNPDDQPNVFSGLKFRLDADLAPNTSFTHRYSGIDWRVNKEDEDSETWPAGTEVEVVKTAVGKMWVCKV